MAHCNLAKNRKRRIVENSFRVIIDDSAMSVCCVLAEAEIGYDCQIPGNVPDILYRLLDYATIVIRTRPFLILCLRYSEEDDRRNSEVFDLLCLVCNRV